MDADELVLWRKRRLYHGSAWKKPVGRVGENHVPATEKATSTGRLEGIKDGPGLMRQHQNRGLTAEPVREDTAADAEF